MSAQGAVPEFSAENKVLDAESNPGHPPLPAEKIPTPTLPEPNPDDDATFLRFPANTGPTVGPNKTRAGAQ